jgi:hypothetical protein
MILLRVFLTNFAQDKDLVNAPLFIVILNPIQYKKFVVLGKDQKAHASNAAIWHK